MQEGSCRCWREAGEKIEAILDNNIQNRTEFHCLFPLYHFFFFYHCFFLSFSLLIMKGLFARCLSDYYFHSLFFLVPLYLFWFLSPFPLPINSFHWELAKPISRSPFLISLYCLVLAISLLFLASFLQKFSLTVLQTQINPVSQISWDFAFGSLPPILFVYSYRLW